MHTLVSQARKRLLRPASNSASGGVRMGHDKVTHIQKENSYYEWETLTITFEDHI